MIHFSKFLVTSFVCKRVGFLSFWAALLAIHLKRTNESVLFAKSIKRVGQWLGGRQANRNNRTDSRKLGSDK
jgi:hypothetical protein